MSVDCLSLQVHCEPTITKGTSSWQRAIERIIEERTGEIRCFVSDRDSAVSRRFRESIKKRFGISWLFLSGPSKAAVAERMIREVKTRLSLAVAASKNDQWWQFLPAIEKSMNSIEIVRGIKRSSVNKHNYLDVVSKKYRRSKDSSLPFHTSSGVSFGPLVSPYVYRFNLDDKVLVRRRVDPNEKFTIFDKSSVEGNYGSTVYVVTGRILKSSSDLYLVPMYKLSRRAADGDLVAVRGFHYQNDLIKVPPIFRDD